jgi:hypothetical protein
MKYIMSLRLSTRPNVCDFRNSVKIVLDCYLSNQFRFVQVMEAGRTPETSVFFNETTRRCTQTSVMFTFVSFFFGPYVNSPRLTRSSKWSFTQSVWYLTTDWSTGVWSPVKQKDFSSSLGIHSSSKAHPASYPMGTGGRFPGVKRGRGVTVTTHPV